jgi:hypothetical protein
MGGYKDCVDFIRQNYAFKKCTLEAVKVIIGEQLFLLEAIADDDSLAS